jgi:hypothetical protein
MIIQKKRTMRIAIEINGVLRNTLDKIQQTYQKYMIDKTDGIEDEDGVIREIKLPIDSLDLRKHFIFVDDDELYSFLYEDFPMEIFGHSQSTEYNTFNDLNEIYINLRDNHDVLIVSDEMGRSKPASLFFLSKFGCQIEKVKFYSNFTINSMWDEIDILLTSNPVLLLEHPEDKILIKYHTEYNKHIETEHSITELKEFEFELKKILKC